MGVVPLLAQERPHVARNSSNSSPILLHSSLPQSLRCALVSDPIMISMMELCPLEFKNVGVVPLLAQERPQDVRNSSNSSPLLLHSSLPQSLRCALVSDPIISVSLCLCA